MNDKNTPKITFQAMIQRLNEYWSSRGCIMWYPHHESVGAGTNNPATILRILGPEPLHVAYVEPSFRPDDGRYALNPNRVQMHHQYQVIIKPIPHSIQQLYLDSLAAIGINYREHDIRFVEDNWESPVLGAWGLGWEVWCDGMEVTQYTYFQQAGALPLNPPACELTYGLERLAMYVQGVSSLWDIQWNDVTTYGELLREQEIRYCSYAFEHADIDRLKQIFELCEKEAELALSKNLPVVAYDYVCRLSHTFNLLDTRGAVALSERVKFFARIRALTRACAESYIKERRSLGFPGLARQNPALPAPLPETSSERPATAPQTSAAENLLIEIGVEELASFVIDPLQIQIETKLPELLQANRFRFEGCTVRITPRRIALTISALSRFQSAETQKLKGPAKEVISRNPKALEGFCRKAGITREQVIYEEDNGTLIATAEVVRPAQSIHEALPALFKELMKGLGVGRAMRWLPFEEGDGAHSDSVLPYGEKIEFNRPIRWIVALFGSEVLPVTYAGLSAGRTTFGPRWSNSQPIPLVSAKHYEEQMQCSKIILDQKARRSLIEMQIKSCAAQMSGHLIDYDSLLDEVTHLVETPTPFIAEFSRDFDDIPGSVKRAIIAKHIRCFPIYASNGAFLPFCIGVRNGTEEHLDVVRAGFERVIVARLSDAKFFIGRDKERSLEDMSRDLTNLTFHEKLGSMQDKAARVEKLANHISDVMKLSEGEHATLLRTASLAKADLASQMVAEMTSLQGEMGALYAEDRGESQEVCLAIREHYLPRYAGDRIPSSRVGVALSLADKIDTLTAFLAIGLEPTGSADPFALRREALGIISLLLNSETAIDLKPIIAAAVPSLPGVDAREVPPRVISFIERRLEVTLRERGLRHDIVRCVLASQTSNPHKAGITSSELACISQDPRFADFLPAYTRCVRIIRKAEADKVLIAPHVSEDGFRESAEKQLWYAISQVSSTIIAHEGLTDRFAKVVSLEHPINSYFDSIMVMAEDSSLRANRLATVRAVARLLDEYGDFTILEGT